MSGIQLEKRVQTVGIVLAKRGLTAIDPLRVGVALDVSGSARSMFLNGTIQETIDRLLAVAVKFDDNQELDVWVFDTDSFELPALTEKEYGSYVGKNILHSPVNDKIWGGTYYAPVLKDMIDEYNQTSVVNKTKGFFGKLFGKQSEQTAEKFQPAMVLFITDGENSDQVKTMKVLEDAAAQNSVYFQMIGVGSWPFTFLQQAADKLPNVGFVNLSTLNMTDEALYEQLVTQEFVEWVKAKK